MATTEVATDIATPTIDEQQIRAIFARFNDRDAFFADPASTWIDRPHYQVFAQSLEMNTRDEVMDWFRGFFDAVPDLHMEVEDVAVAGEPGRERVTVRWFITGTFSGGPMMGIEATGRPVAMRGMDLIDIQDGRVAGNAIYYDGLAFARQVGLLPREGSGADRLVTRAFNGLTAVRKRFRGGS
jgi:steroid delta-isomerase-like uncharacterized protein